MVDGKKPEGENWHQALLQQIAIEVPSIRPAVISEAVCRQLDEYRGFRHVVRNIYTFQFDPAKVSKLVGGAPELFWQARAELLAFAKFLEHRGG